MNYICFDLEGPLSPQDNAYELMKLFPNGDRIFEVISRYDDLLALEGKEDYEPGDTLSLIVPFLVIEEGRWAHALAAALGILEIEPEPVKQHIAVMVFARLVLVNQTRVIQIPARHVPSEVFLRVGGEIPG